MAGNRKAVSGGGAVDDAEVIDHAFIAAITGSTTEPAIEVQYGGRDANGDFATSRIVRTDIRPGDLIQHRGVSSRLTLARDDEGVVKVVRIEPE